MRIKFDNADLYKFHHRDDAGKCFRCSKNERELLIVRHINSGKMVHLCGDCLLKNLSDYLLDNTRPWRDE